MKIKQLTRLYNQQVVEVALKQRHADQLTENDAVTLHLMDDLYFIRQGGQIFELDEHDSLLSLTGLDFYLWQLVAVKQQQLFLQGIPCLPSNITFAQNLTIAVDDKVFQDCTRFIKRINPTFNDVLEWLKQQFYLDEVLYSGLLLAIYPGETAKRELTGLNTTTLTCIGHEYHLIIEFTADQRLWVRRILPAPTNVNHQTSLLSASVEFVDAGLAVQLKDPLVNEKLAELQRNNTAYIALWQEYNRIAELQALEAAKSAGCVRYVRCEFNDHVDGAQWQFYYNEKDNAAVEVLVTTIQAKQDCVLEVATEKPDWLSNDASAQDGKQPQDKESFNAKYARRTNQFLVLKTEQQKQPPEKGVIYLSISGTMVQMQRREKARNAITAAANPMPQLRALIENIDFDLGRSAHRPIKPMTPTVRKGFKANPTDKQVKALDVALNTPDIALILGPPGTGKTQVISALQHRLAEVHQGDLTANILLTSYQNDAVDNVVAKSRAFGIPAIRADDPYRANQLITQWCKQQSADLKQPLSQFNQHDTAWQLIKTARAAIAVLLNKRTDDVERQHYCQQLVDTVNVLRGGHGFKVTQVLQNRLAGLETIFSPNSIEPQKIDTLLNKVRGLRTTETSFADDGFETICRCISALKRNGGHPQALGELTDITKHIESPNPQLLARINKVKDTLIDLLVASRRPKILRRSIPQPAILILHATDALLNDQLASSVAGIPDVLTEYLEVLGSQPDYVIDSVQQYTVAVGASCQRAISDKVAEYKHNVALTEIEPGQGITFDTVIVDEAARANPLDLFIPMSLAKRRIVLVGDYYQLPQMLEPDVEKAMEQTANFSQMTAEALKQSLFQKLYEQLKAREASDGKPRTVMLDTQFRMHPKIGDFVSRYFYESQGEDKIKSVLPEANFAVDLPGYDQGVAKWIDIPNKGKEGRRAHSYFRIEEATKVADIVQSLLAMTTALSVGVITFYAPQREEIFKALQQRKICSKTDDGWEYDHQYQTTDDGEERLRVGSVDAFQGKEFDLVILSTVRSNKYKGLKEASLNSKFGFIRTPNRLNVAFSRAKRFITVVGDRQMFSGAEAKLAVPAIAGFIDELCPEEEQ